MGLDLPFNHLESDDDFAMALLDLNSNTTVDLRYLNSLSFNPLLFTNFDKNDTLPEDSVDIPTANYLLEDNFNNKFSKCPDNFSIFHHNARSITKNIDNINHYLNQLHHKF